MLPPSGNKPVSYTHLDVYKRQDRNRTSPFAFTGNKFEFRMLGSEASVANPNIILNTAVAECVHQFAEQLKDVPEDKMEDAIHELIKKTIIDHKRVIFNGNGYTDEWIEEATKRGLFNPVSYTHLDVYKRQSENRIDAGPSHGSIIVA